MRIYHWQGGVFLHPETTKETRELRHLVKTLEKGLTSIAGMLTLKSLSFFAKSLATAKVGDLPRGLGVPPILIDDDDDAAEEEASSS